MGMGFYKNSENDYICEYCNAPPFVNLQDVIDHVATHNVDSVSADSSKNAIPEIVPVPTNIPAEINEYYDDLEKGGTLQAAERLMMSLIEDYTISRNADLREKNKIGPMTLSLGKVAAEAINNYNKLKTINKSVNVNLDASKKSDIDALKEMLAKGKDE